MRLSGKARHKGCFASGVRLEFDRGTILVEEPVQGIDLAQLPGVLWDPRVGSFRVSAHRYEELAAALGARGVRFSDAVRKPDEPVCAWDEPPLRPYQASALLAWEIARRRGVVVLPTGAGKTRVAIAALARCGKPGLCIVPTRVLLEQWMTEIRQWYRGTIGCLGDGEHRIEAITIATSESAYRHMDRLGNRFEILIVDEAHHFGAGIRDEALEMSIAPARLGLTATMPTAPEALRNLAAKIGPVVFERAISDLAGRYLADFDVCRMWLDLTSDERVRYDSLMAAFREVVRAVSRTSPGATWTEFARAAARTDAGREALAGFRRARAMLAWTVGKRRALAELMRRHRQQRVLVFTGDNESAYAVSRIHLVPPITCDITRAERQVTLQRFREGTVRAIVSSRVLNEGVDVPDAEVGIVVGAAHGEREHVQRVGRLLRPRDGKRAVVYELVTRRTLEASQAERRRVALERRTSA